MRVSFLKRTINKIKGLFMLKNVSLLPVKNITRDHVDLTLWGLRLSVTRETTSDIPSELSVIIPRAEFRHDCEPKIPETCDTEIILSSLTVVISPRHPQERVSSPSTTGILIKRQPKNLPE